MTETRSEELANNWLHRSGWEGNAAVEDAVRQFAAERRDMSAGWEGACREMILGSAEDRDRSIALAGLLGQARAYVADALDAHEHSDGRELLVKIDSTLAPYLTRALGKDHDNAEG